MTPDEGPLGICPNCGREIRPMDELITYERSDSSLGIFAECPSCEAVIEPKG